MKSASLAKSRNRAQTCMSLSGVLVNGNNIPHAFYLTSYSCGKLTATSLYYAAFFYSAILFHCNHLLLNPLNPARACKRS